MPNHVTNVLVIGAEGSKLQEIKKFMASDQTAIDFNQIIPRPKELDITSGSSVDYGIAVILATEHGNYSKINDIMEYPWVKDDAKIKTREDLIKHLSESESSNLIEARQALENKKKYGHQDWYSWSIANWGTKWNAYDIDEMEDGVRFDTAWSTPFKVMVALSERFPDVEFTVHYADEDFGNNTGYYTLLNGSIVMEDAFEDDLVGAYQNAIEVKGYSYMEESLEEYVDEINEGDCEYTLAHLKALIRLGRIPTRYDNTPKEIVPKLIEIATELGEKEVVEQLELLEK